jgi:hypothetical protein
MLNGRFEEVSGKTIHWDSHVKNPGDIDLKNFLETQSYPKSPRDKLENLVSELYALQTYDGESVDLDRDEAWIKFFFRNDDEFVFYLNTLEKQGDIELDYGSSTINGFSFTYQGIANYVARLSEGYTSKKCFIAMAFTPETTHIRNAIKSAVSKAGFDPIVMDEKDIESDMTINDAIISNLRQCKFCVADFTHHRNGVYFESGFALGQGKPVIYLCSKSHFAEAHFDIKPLQHIVYETTDELERRLIAKIEAWIK